MPLSPGAPVTVQFRAAQWIATFVAAAPPDSVDVKWESGDTQRVAASSVTAIDLTAGRPRRRSTPCEGACTERANEPPNNRAGGDARSAPTAADGDEGTQTAYVAALPSTILQLLPRAAGPPLPPFGVGATFKVNELGYGWHAYEIVGFFRHEETGFFAGIIQRVERPGFFTIAFDDGTHHSGYARERIRARGSGGGGSVGGKNDADLAVGRKVEARWRGEHDGWTARLRFSYIGIPEAGSVFGGCRRRWTPPRPPSRTTPKHHRGRSHRSPD